MHEYEDLEEEKAYLRAWFRLYVPRNLRVVITDEHVSTFNPSTGKIPKPLCGLYKSAQKLHRGRGGYGAIWRCLLDVLEERGQVSIRPSHRVFRLGVPVLIRELRGETVYPNVDKRLVHRNIPGYVESVLDGQLFVRITVPLDWRDS